MFFNVVTVINKEEIKIETTIELHGFNNHGQRDCAFLRIVFSDLIGSSYTMMQAGRQAGRQAGTRT